MFVLSCNTQERKTPKSIIEQQCNQIRSYFEPYGKPKDFTWQYLHPEETNQSLDQYIGENPSSITKDRNKIYMLPMGNFSSAELNVINETSAYIEAFFGLEVAQLPTIKMPEVPGDMKRIRSNEIQYNASYFIDQYLNTKQYKDAAVLIALTCYDLYPQDSWSYVFGLASLQKRVGIWSINRFGDPSLDSCSYKLCLNRTQKVATHEIGHMFSIQHCVVFPCVMNGSNCMPETDNHPSVLCPDCLAKLSWNLDMAPNEHLKRALNFWKQKGDSANTALYLILESTAK